MVELTIKEKAKRYDKAIEIAKSKIKYDRDHILNEDDIIAIFPELKKSEDEIIKKALLEMVNDTKCDDLWINYNVHKGDAIAWLEKQNKQKTNTTQYCCILDFNTGKAFKHCITEDELNLTSEELLDKYGFNADECSIMYTSNNLELKLLEN